MREFQLKLNETQKIRLDKALQQIQALSSKNNSSASASVIVADTIPVNHEDGVLKGHGTSDLDGEVVATLCGVVERVNKLVYVRTLRARYKPEIGDIVVGRVIELVVTRHHIPEVPLLLVDVNRNVFLYPTPRPVIVPKRWRIEINFSQDAVLMLSSMNMPDGIQRRRTAVDELNMRSIFEENDVICAEVRGVQHDGSLHLQARSRKYGKLERGQLLTIPPYLVKRRKQHFHHLEQYGIDLILGCNGFIWVGEHVEVRDPMIEDHENKPYQQSNMSDRNLVSIEEQERTYTPLETRQVICRIANAVRVVSSLGFNLTVEQIMDIVEMSISLNIEIHEMLGAEFYVQIAEREVERRSSSGKRK